MDPINDYSQQENIFSSLYPKVTVIKFDVNSGLWVIDHTYYKNYFPSYIPYQN